MMFSEVSPSQSVFYVCYHIRICLKHSSGCCKAASPGFVLGFSNLMLRMRY